MLWVDSLYPALIVNWLTSPGGTRHCITKFIVEDAIMKTLLPNVKEGANKRGNSSRLTQSFHFFMFEPIFSPVNALNQPI
ncbi:hypothetical protein FV274_26675 [Escherichia coli]|nr:hypothetical protein FV274_26675 [Escherichia coli]